MKTIANTIANIISFIIKPFTWTTCMSKYQEAEHDAKIAKMKKEFKPIRLVGMGAQEAYERQQAAFAKRKGMDM